MIDLMKLNFEKQPLLLSVKGIRMVYVAQDMTQIIYFGDINKSYAVDESPKEVYEKIAAVETSNILARSV